MKKIILGVLMLFVLSGCTDNANAERVLLNDGYSKIQFTGYSFLACGQDDTYSTGFVAIKNGRTITGTVCSGLLFKGSTIRFD